MTYVAATVATVEGVTCSGAAIADGSATSAAAGKWDRVACVTIGTSSSLTAHSGTILAFLKQR